MIGAFVDGPLWYFSAGVFLMGVAWRLVSILRLGVEADLAVPRHGGAGGALWTIFSRSWPRRSLTERAKLPVIAGYMFHLGLLALLFFAKPHVDFYAERVTGFGWASMPRWAFIVTAEVAFAGLMMLWLYRVLNPVTRLLSSVDDHLAAWLIFLVMLTGCMALLEHFEPLRILHLFLAELLLIYFPFGSLMHTFTFALSRGYTGATMARRGIAA